MDFKLFLVLFFLPYFYFAQSYDYYHDGDTSDVITSPSYGVCLMGGASENDLGAEWFLNRADGGNILVLRTSGADGYQNYFYNNLGVTVQSVETIVFNNALAANDPFVLRKIENAEAIWLAGGDQYLYELYFKSTMIKTLLNAHINTKGAPIGGTSAGMAIMGEFYFNAENGTIASSDALSNPYHSNLTVESSFIDVSILTNTITDTHYDNPDRRGRHVAFLSRMQEMNANEDYFGIGVDEFVAICIDSNGIATVYGEYPGYEDNAFFIRTNCTRAQPSVLQGNTPLTWDANNSAILACNIKGTEDGLNQFNLNTWLDINGGIWEGWSAGQGQLLTEQIQHSGCTSKISEAEADNNHISLYPNPANNKIFIKSNKEVVKIELYDLNGKLLTSNQNTNILSINSFKAGFYQIKVRLMNKEEFTIKLVKVDS
jgi:cyanophycinase-like exopeptidase